VSSSKGSPYFAGEACKGYRGGCALDQTNRKERPKAMRKDQKRIWATTLETSHNISIAEAPLGIKFLTIAADGITI
jgi:hypothetical protein